MASYNELLTVGQLAQLLYRSPRDISMLFYRSCVDMTRLARLDRNWFIPQFEVSSIAKTLAQKGEQ